LPFARRIATSGATPHSDEPEGRTAPHGAAIYFPDAGSDQDLPRRPQDLREHLAQFYNDAKIGVVGVNGSGKSTLLKIMAGLDNEFNGEARAADGIKRGYLEQEPQLDPALNVRQNVEA
jgi:ABC-type polysaccharide/polyol phosphate transport system ATPase subunit